MARGHYPRPGAGEPLRSAEPTSGSPSARADRRAHAARRAGRELLVSPAPGGVRMDRRAGCRRGRARHGLRRGLRVRGAGPIGRPGGRRRRQSRGARARQAPLHGPEPDVRVGRGRDVRRARRVRRGRVPADDRARDRPAGGARALPPDPQAGRRRVRLDAERAEARAGGTGEVRQPLAPARVPGVRVRRAVPGHVRRRRDARAVPCAQAPRPRGRARARLGRGAQAARNHRRVLRPVHAGDRLERLRASDASGSTARSTSSPSAAPERIGAWTARQAG